MNLGGTVHLNRMGICVVFFCFLIVALYMTRDDQESEPKKFPSYNIKHILTAAIELAEKGGEQVVQVRKSADLKVKSKGQTLEGANNPVTEADHNSHCVMYFGLKKLFPQVKVSYYSLHFLYLKPKACYFFYILTYVNTNIDI